MVSHKNRKNHQPVQSATLHTPKPRHVITEPKNHSSKIILAVIILAFLAVAAAAFSTVFFTPERITKSQLSHLAADYYENYHYPQLSSSPNFSPTDESMDRYVKNGFARVTLRQLLLYNPVATADIADNLLEYCDENSTFVIFYPDPPYDRTSYHTDFHYSCDF